MTFNTTFVQHLAESLSFSLPIGFDFLSMGDLYAFENKISNLDGVSSVKLLGSPSHNRYIGGKKIISGSLLFKVSLRNDVDTINTQEKIQNIISNSNIQNFQ